LNSPSPVSKAVFISYASQDAEAARRIAEALRAGGVEVWLDQSELRGGDAWDASIRRQIKGCRLFLAVISANTQAREEGYFRREWNLAVARMLDMAEDAAFLVPVVIDGTSDAEARVPERFRDRQWTRLPAGETPAAFVARVQALATGVPAPGPAPTPAKAPATQAHSAAGAHLRQPAQDARAHATPTRKRSPQLLLVGTIVLAAFVGGGLLLRSWQSQSQARNVLLPALQDKVATMVRSSRPLFDEATALEQRLPGDPGLAKLWPAIANTLSIETEPAGAAVYWKDYDRPADVWRLAGVTPLKDAKIARDFLRIEVRKAGYQTVELAEPSFTISVLRPIKRQLQLDKTGALPEGMVRIPASKTEMAVIGLEKHGPRVVPAFLIDRHEVTNRQYKAFVDAGGYTNPAFWTQPISDGGKPLPLPAALAKFKDRTGRTGPATWEAGSFPDGMGDHPVTGVSWYEAAAYAAWVHKQLPTVFHYAAAADTSRAEFLVPLSNFNGKSTLPVGSLAGFGTYGVYDLAGNAREWMQNRSAGRGIAEQHFILGGGWQDATYAFNDSFAQPSFDRSEGNGFRCIQALESGPEVAALGAPLAMDFRDYAQEKPVSDAVFAGYARQFTYDKTPVAAKIESETEAEGWKEQVVSIDAGYNKERLLLHVFLPKDRAGPFQPVVFYSGSNGIFESHFDTAVVKVRLQFILKSGRALVFPVNKGTYERQDDLKTDLQEETVRYKDHVLMWVKEFSRTIDYLETRKDMQADKASYLGISWGGFMGGIIPAIEKRFKAVVLNVGGMEMEKALPEVDQINYLPRVTQPVLMLNGSYDMYFPVETSQKPLFRFLGTPAAQKRMVVYPSGHLVPPNEFVKETLAWLDNYVGPVN
jgi:formylglycine-generating enzyme required for sulfatase activity